MRNELMDHPVICNLERTGHPEGKEPAQPHCPICGETCETIYQNSFGNYVGCDVCTKTRDAWDIPDCFPEYEYEKGDYYHD